jgi:DNA-binding MarR family transcriptional regulator
LSKFATEVAETRPQGAGSHLPLLLFAGFRALIDELHAELARRGHPEVRPAHGFALQAIGTDGASASDLGRRLGVSKQAAGKTVDNLVRLGYAERVDDPADARRKLVRLTPRGVDVLICSGEILDGLWARWAGKVGADRLGDVEVTLRAVAGEVFRLDVPGWFGGAD